MEKQTALHVHLVRLLVGLVEFLENCAFLPEVLATAIPLTVS
jgi:hypothetical protein